MKVYVSYVIQDDLGHQHYSKYLNFTSPPYTFSSDPPVDLVIDWAKVEEATLKTNQKIIITSIYKM